LGVKDFAMSQNVIKLGKERIFKTIASEDEL